MILSLDVVATLLALHLAVWLRFDGMVPAPYLAALPAVLPLLAGARIVSNMAVGIHRWSFRLAGLPDALRVVTAGLVGTLAFTVLCTQVVPGGMPRSVYVLEFFLATASFGALRFAPRAGLRWLGKRARTKAGAARTIIVGSGDAAELLARDLQRSSDSPYALVGFVSEDPSLVGRRLDGSRVLGLVRELPELLRRYCVTTVLLADQGQSAARRRQILDMCATCRARFKIIPAALDQIERLSVAMLGDVAPEDLLPRDSVAFDEAEIRALVCGRRALVTPTCANPSPFCGLASDTAPRTSSTPRPTSTSPSWSKPPTRPPRTTSSERSTSRAWPTRAVRQGSSSSPPTRL